MVIDMRIFFLVVGSLTSVLFYIGIEGEGGIDIMSKLSKKVLQKEYVDVLS